MTDSSVPKVSKVPFLLVDLVLVGLGWFIANQGHRPILMWEAIALVVCAALGAYCTIVPFLREYDEEVKQFQSDKLTTVTTQIQNLEMVGSQINQASAQLYAAIEASGKAVTAADEIAKRMSVEAMQFAEFMAKANDTEKGHLRLEVDKLRRVEGEWLQIVVRMLDHTYAVNQAAVRTGQRNLIEQLGQFQNACRDAARRVGVTALIPAQGDAFDEKLHQVIEGQTPTPGARIADVVATGYTFQGQLIRPSLVVLQTTASPQPEPVADADPSLATETPKPAAGQMEEPSLL